jgi:fatty-acyl-CoA synthase/long-chain acyl-CoA synthetase
MMSANNPTTVDGISHAAGGGSSLTLTGAIEQSLKRFQDRVAIEIDDEQYTFEELDKRSNAVANALIGRGVDPGDRVAIMMSNCIEYVVADLALLKMGAVKLPLNDMLTEDEFEYMLSDSRASTAIAGPNFIGTLDRLDDRVEGIHRRIGIADEVPDSFERFATLEDEGDSRRNPDIGVSPEDPCGHFYTGGTTGDPKGVIHSQDNFLTCMYSHLMGLDITSRDTLLLMTPLPHSAGAMLWAALLAGSKTVVRDGFDPEQALSDIEDGVTWTFLVPTMIYTVLEHPDLEKTDTSSLETLVYGAAPMTPARLREGIEAFGQVFIQFYGQTEVPNVITVLDKEDHRIALESENEHRLSSAGQPALMADVKIHDPDGSGRKPRGEEGEIMATAPYVLDEYWEQPKKTEETVENGWVHTGDIGKRDEDGFVYLLDRKSNMIISGGMNVYSTEVEEALAAHPKINQVAVIGVPDEKWGEAVTAIIVPTAEDAVDETDITNFADDELADYKKPKEVEFMEELPKTPYGKIDKKALREPYWEEEGRDIS